VFRLPESTYGFRAEYNTEQYQATAYIPAHQVTPVSLDISGGTISLTLKSSASTVLVGIPCSLYDAAGNSLDRSTVTDSQGMVGFDVTAGDYVIAVAYLGAEFKSNIFSVPGTLSDTLLVEHQQVAVTVTGADGLTEEPLAGLRCSLFTESGVDTGVIAETDANGTAYFNVPFNSYRIAVDYLGQQYWTEPFDWFDTTLAIPLGSLSLHVTDSGADVADADVYLFTDTGEYLGLNNLTDAAGAAVLQAPEGAYRLRVDFNDTQYWSNTIHVLAYQDNPITLALDLLALDLTNNPNPKRFDGKAPEYRPMIASVGSVDGLLAQTVTQLLPNNDPKTYYYISDHLSTAQLLVDEVGEVVWQGNYSPFGAVDVVINELENSFRFPGQYYDDETGLHYNWHRFYDPQTGRYISADPIGLAGGMNLYAYALGNPTNLTDPEGLIAAPAIPIIIILIPPTIIALDHAIKGTRDAMRNRDNTYEMGERKKGETEPYSLPIVNPGRDCDGNCKPCPPDSSVWEHTHQDGVTNKHQIIYNQDPETCVCYPFRIHL
ncbi:MAG: RHS repeat-associated core domain-containing protein, partial [Nitrospirota bacterium]